MMGQISLFPYNFAPAGWMFCEGQLLPIPQNDVLFQLLGTTYGGDGEETFALPDLTAAAPPNLHYCISLFGEFGTSTYTYNAIIGETMVAIPSLVARNLLQAAGQSMLNNSYLLLSAYMGTRFGGDATHFSLPDLRSKAPGKCQYLIAVQGDPPNNLSARSPFLGEILLLPYQQTINTLLPCSGGSTSDIGKYGALRFDRYDVRWQRYQLRFAESHRAHGLHLLSRVSPDCLSSSRIKLIFARPNDVP